MTDAHLERLRRYVPETFKQLVFPETLVTWPLVFQIASLPALSFDREVIKEWNKAIKAILWMNSHDRPDAIAELGVLGEHRRFSPLRKEEVAELGLIPGVDYRIFRS